MQQPTSIKSLLEKTKSCLTLRLLLTGDSQESCSILNGLNLRVTGITYKSKSHNTINTAISSPLINRLQVGANRAATQHYFRLSERTCDVKLELTNAYEDSLLLLEEVTLHRLGDQNVSA